MSSELCCWALQDVLSYIAGFEASCWHLSLVSTNVEIYARHSNEVLSSKDDLKKGVIFLQLRYSWWVAAVLVHEIA